MIKNSLIKFLRNILQKNSRINLSYLRISRLSSNPKDLRLNLFDTFQKKKINYGYSDHSVYGLSDDFLSLLPIILEKNSIF